MAGEREPPNACVGCPALGTTALCCHPASTFNAIVSKYRRYQSIVLWHPVFEYRSPISARGGRTVVDNVAVTQLRSQNRFRIRPSTGIYYLLGTRTLLRSTRH